MAKISVEIKEETEIDEEDLVDWRVMAIVDNMVGEDIKKLMNYSKKEYSDEEVSDFMNEVMLAIADKIIEEDD
jgi:hypothetical protein